MAPERVMNEAQQALGAIQMALCIANARIAEKDEIINARGLRIDDLERQVLNLKCTAS